MSPKLNPSDACDVLLSYVKRSNLNFQISESPFSVNIEIKKSFIRNKNGVERSASFDDISDTLKHENQLLIALNCALKISLAQKDEEKSAFREKIKELETALYSAAISTSAYPCDTFSNLSYSNLFQSFNPAPDLQKTNKESKATHSLDTLMLSRPTHITSMQPLSSLPHYQNVQQFSLDSQPQPSLSPQKDLRL